MATRKITPSTEPQRRCIGSATFGIEPHQAALADFPLQPSRKDGIGLLCKPHWTLYTRSLRQAARAAGDARRDRHRAGAGGRTSRPTEGGQDQARAQAGRGRPRADSCEGAG